MAEFLTYSKFHSLPEARKFILILENAGIKFSIDHERDVLDNVYTGHSHDPMIAIKIAGDRFEHINSLLLLEAQSQLSSIDPDYYLFSFSDEELADVIHNRNEWNHFDQALAIKIMTDRKIAIPAAAQKTMEAESYDPKHLESLWLISQYLLTVLVPYVGFIVGLATLFAYKTLKSGAKIKMYDDSTRLHAKIMLGLGAVPTFLFLWPGLRYLLNL